MSTQSSTHRIERLPFVSATILGGLAWLTGYFLTHITVESDIRDTGLHRVIEALDGEPATYEMVGWVFYNAHFVNTVFENVPFFGSYSTTYIGGNDGFTVFLYVVPIGLLIASGIAIGAYRRVTSVNQGLVTGMAIMPGYAFLSVAGVFLLEVTVSGASGQPDIFAAIVLAGFLYPLVFGAIGGGLQGYISSR